MLKFLDRKALQNCLEKKEKSLPSKDLLCPRTEIVKFTKTRGTKEPKQLKNVRWQNCHPKLIEIQDFKNHLQW